MIPRRPSTLKRKTSSKIPRINEKRSEKPNLSGMTLEQATEVAELIDTKVNRVGVQRKKSSIAPNKIKMQYAKGK